MKASELIKELEELVGEYGDLEVGYDGGYGEINGVVFRRYHELLYRIMKTDDPSRITDLLLAAKQWWLGKRPPDYTKEDHFENPEVNCVGSNEKRLAKAIACFYKPLKGIGK